MNIMQLLDEYQLTTLVIALFYCVLIFFSIKIIFKIILSRKTVDSSFFTKILLESIQAPLIIALILEALWNFIDFSYFIFVFDFTPAILVFYFCYSFVTKSEFRLTILSREKTETTAKYALSRFASLAVMIISTIYGFHLLGIDITGFVTLSAAGTLVLGFASKELLANFFGSFIIFMDKPFIIGDKISSAEKKIAGVVQNIGWRITEIKTDDGHLLYIPNSSFSSIGIKNETRLNKKS